MTTAADPAVEAGQIAYERRGALGLVRLTRPDVLNAVSHAMVRSLDATLARWAEDDGVRAVAIVGEGAAFSAGGDIREIYDRGRAGEPFDAFFADEYALNIRIKRYPKPYLAFSNGIAMGGGVGVGYHGSHVVVGERARFAMPECGIGFFPDVGATSFLPRLPDGVGTALGMTGRRIDAATQVAVGLATHAVPTARHARVLERLAEGATPEEALGDGTADPESDTEPGDGAAATVAELASIGAEIGARPVEPSVHTEGRCPVSLAVTARQLERGAELDFERCMALEARIVHRMLRRNDFYEGIRAAIIDKDQSPAWDPASIRDVPDELVERHFEAVTEGPLAALSAAL